MEIATHVDYQDTHKEDVQNLEKGSKAHATIATSLDTPQTRVQKAKAKGRKGKGTGREKEKGKVD